MNIADLIRREADSWSRQATLVRETDSTADDLVRKVAVILRNIAGVTEVHGLAGLHGYMAARHFSTPVTDPTKAVIADVIARILRGEGH